jgi:hypothetical protein
MNRQFDWSTVKVVETTPAKFKTSKSAALAKTGAVKPFAIVDLSETAKVAAMLTSAAQLFVWIWIIHQMKKRNSKVVVVSSSALAVYGISRRVKTLALDRMKAAGLVSVEQVAGRSPVVKVLRHRL